MLQTICDVGPTLKQERVDASCLLVSETFPQRLVHTQQTQTICITFIQRQTDWFRSLSAYHIRLYTIFRPIVWEY